MIEIKEIVKVLGELKDKTIDLVGLTTIYDNLSSKPPTNTEVSKYVSYKEVIYSQTAARNDIPNNPTEGQLELIRECAKKVFDPLREWVGGPIKITSGFRSPELNKRIGGSQSSQHSVGLDKSRNSYGAAFDIDDGYGHKTNREMFHYIKDKLAFDQVIWEFGTTSNPDWVHVSYRPDGKNRKQVLIAYKSSGRTKYCLLKGNEHRIT